MVWGGLERLAADKEAAAFLRLLAHRIPNQLNHFGALAACKKYASLDKWVVKPRTGEHFYRTPDKALEVMCSMAGRWSNEHIAATLDRMALPPGKARLELHIAWVMCGMVNDIGTNRSAKKDGQWLTMSEAAAKLA